MAKGISLAPCGLIIDRIEPEADALIIVARPASDFAACPTCGQRSNSVHSRYQRMLSDLPSQGGWFGSRFLPAGFVACWPIADSGFSLSAWKGH